MDNGGTLQNDIFALFSFSHYFNISNYFQYKNPIYLNDVSTNNIVIWQGFF